MNIPELRQVAESFGVDLIGVKGKTSIISAIEAEGVTYEMYNTIALAEKVPTEEVEVVSKPTKPTAPSAETILIKMERKNGTYETYGLRFTKEHPYALADLDTAQIIFDNEQGFRPATPKELQEFYS